MLGAQVFIGHHIWSHFLPWLHVFYGPNFPGFLLRFWSKSQSDSNVSFPSCSFYRSIFIAPVSLIIVTFCLTLSHSLGSMIFYCQNLACVLRWSRLSKRYVALEPWFKQTQVCTTGCRFYSKRWNVFFYSLKLIVYLLWSWKVPMGSGQLNINYKLNYVHLCTKCRHLQYRNSAVQVFDTLNLVILTVRYQCYCCIQVNLR